VSMRLPQAAVLSVYLDAYSNRTGPLQFEAQVVTAQSDALQTIASGKVASGVERSRSLLLWPESEVSQLRIEFELEPGDVVFLNRLAVNRRIPYAPDLLRLALLLLGCLLLYFLFKAPVFWRQARADDLAQRLVSTATAAVIVILCFWLAIAAASEPFFAVSETGGDFYSRDFADALRRGRFDLLISPPPELAELENPYDPALRETIDSTDLIEGAVYYNERYYVSYGIVPALLFFAPFRQLYGYTFQTIWAVTLFGAFGALLLYLNLRRLLLILFPRLPFRWHYIAGTTVCVACFTGWGLASPSIDSMSRLGGFFFAMLAANQLLYLIYGHKGLPARSLIREAVWSTQGNNAGEAEELHQSDEKPPLSDEKTCHCDEKPRQSDNELLQAYGAYDQTGRISCWRLLLVGTFLLLAVGCHPVEGFLLVPYAIVFFLKLKQLKNKIDVLPALVCFIVPLLIGGFLLGSYNLARFSSAFEFGGQYQLALADMRSTGIKWARLIPGLAQHLFIPPAVNAEFPFIHFRTGTGLFPNSFSKNARTIGLLTLPFLLILLLLPFFKKLRNSWQNASFESKALLHASLLTGFVFTAHNSLVRDSVGLNALDFAVWFALAAALIWLMTANLNFSQQSELNQGSESGSDLGGELSEEIFKNVDNSGFSPNIHILNVEYPQIGDNCFTFFLLAGILTTIICGLLFIQGESDSISNYMPQFYERLRRMMAFWLP
ncbi:MAG: hypothetical protein GX749_00790, partial [Ruminococcaceae bacterium]|nr:hypothetical protein [Oscillospiraceae bacterium]